MRASLKLIFAGLAVLSFLSLGGFVAFWLEQNCRLEFKERTDPPGFRELVIANTGQFLDPISISPPAANRRTRPTRGARELCDALFRDPGSPTFGGLGGSTQVAVFFDYRCPHCRTLLTTLSAIQAGQLRIVYKDWPVLGAASELAARAALAADKQGYYRPFHQRLMASRFIPTTALIEAIAIELGMNVSKLKQDMVAAPVALTIQRHHDLALDLQLVGTPALIVDRTIIQGTVPAKQAATLFRRVAESDPVKLCQS